MGSSVIAAACETSYLCVPSYVIMENAYKIETSPDHYQVMQWLDDGLYDHNSKKIEKYDGSNFSRVVRSEGRALIGGIAGWTWAGACEITHLWIDERFRGQGIGKMLLEAAEAEARGHGCRIIMVRSFSFQAPAFYERHGYRTEYRLEGFPAGYGHHTLTKAITYPAENPGI